MMLLLNRYRVLKTLANGGFGETFLAEDTQMPSLRHCVIKQLKPIQNNSQIYQMVQERFQREAVILEELGGESSQIPTLYANFQLNGQFYLVQEYIQGKTLTESVESQGAIGENVVLAILTSLLSVLSYVHSKRIIHRDIKPDNIILRDRDSKPVLIDFGAVKEIMGTVANSQGRPVSSIIIGTPGYMPSEQGAGRPVYSSDLYSLGLTAIYLLTGYQPDQLETDSLTSEIVWDRLASNVNPSLKSILDKAIAYHPRDRFASAKEMLDALQSGVVVSAPVNRNPQTITLPPKPQQAIPLTSAPKNQDKKQNGVVVGSLIAGSLIGVSVIAGMMLTKPSEKLASQPVANQAAPENTTTPQPAPENTTTLPKQTDSPDTTPTDSFSPANPQPNPPEKTSENTTTSQVESFPPANTQPETSENTTNSQAESFASTNLRPKPPEATFEDSTPVQQPTPVITQTKPVPVQPAAPVITQIKPLPVQPAAPVIPQTKPTPNPVIEPKVPDNSTVKANITRPSPEKEVVDYLNEINSRQYQAAWDRLPTALQANTNVHPNGFSSFQTWWDKMNSVDVKEVNVIESNGDRAKVNVRLAYNFKDGSVTPSSLRYSLSWDSQTQKWKITRINS